MYGLSPAIAILDITMGKLSKLRPQVPFNGWKAKTSSDGERSHSEKDKYVGSYDNAPIPRLTIHSFIMGIFVRFFTFSSLPLLRDLWVAFFASNQSPKPLKYNIANSLLF
jgi:hypothetical protein